MSSGKKGQIDSANIVIGQVFSRFWFRIPDYQRAYVWGKDEISELIEDVNYASEHNPEGQNFLGSMVLRKAARTMDGVSFEEYELLDGAIYGRRSARYVLLRLEYLLASHAAPLNLPDEISVEHIMPQTPGKTSQWLKDFTEEQRDAWLHRLGNLMLLSRRKNTSLGNLDFANKRVRYFDDRVESLPNLQRLLALGTFALTDLEARHKDFLERLGRSYEAKP